MTVKNFTSGDEFNTVYLDVLSPNRFAITDKERKMWENIPMKEWKPNTKYVRGDIIERNNCVFLARVDFTSEEEFNNEHNFL